MKTYRIIKRYAPWLNTAVKELKLLRDNALQVYKTTQHSDHWETYKNLRNQVTAAVKREKRAYFKTKLSNCQNSKATWSVMRELVNYICTTSYAVFGLVIKNWKTMVRRLCGEYPAGSCNKAGYAAIPGSTGYPITGPALFKILSLKQCKAYEDSDIIASARLHMYNKTTQLFDINISVPFDIDENVKGNYTLKDVYVDLEKFKIKMFLEGSFHTRTEFWKGARKVGCLEAEFQVSPNIIENAIETRTNQLIKKIDTLEEIIQNLIAENLKITTMLEKIHCKDGLDVSYGTDVSDATVVEQETRQNNDSHEKHQDKTPRKVDVSKNCTKIFQPDSKKSDAQRQRRFKEISRFSRSHHKGGGVGIWAHDSLSVSKLELSDYCIEQHFEICGALWRTSIVAKVIENSISDHNTILCSTNLGSTPKVSHTEFKRSFKAHHVNCFKQDLNNHSWSYLYAHRNLDNAFNDFYGIVGPALLKILSVKHCKTYEHGDLIATFRLHMYNKTTRLFDANFSVPFDIDENVKGNYTLRNVYVDLEKFKIKMFLEGHFYIKSELSKGARTLSCLEYEVQLSPKILIQLEGICINSLTNLNFEMKVKRYPRNEEIKSKWLAAIPRKNWSHYRL
nr:unnamed protein product [Callosobruchus analis]